MVLTVAAAIFVFGMLVLVHELGHFVTAKLTGMRVNEFAIGFGPQLFSIHYGETEYSVRCIPLGGFNDIAGMNPEENDAGERGYCEKPILSRMLVILSGSAMNLLLPIIIFFGIFFFAGVSTPSTEPVIGGVLPDRPAAVAGIQKGDRILSVDDTEIAKWSDFVLAVKDSPDKDLRIRYERDGVQQETVVTPTYDKTRKLALVGVMSSVTTEHPGIFESMWLAVSKTWEILSMMIYELTRILWQFSGEELSGPIGIAQMAGEMAQFGMVTLLNFAAFLSLNLGILNLFPIPALDGGHFLTLLVEAVRGKPMSTKALQYAQAVGVALLVTLMLFATKNDIVRVVTGG